MATSIRKTDDTHSEAETDSGWPRGVRLAVLGGLAFAHLVLCTILTFRYSPTENEVAHLPAGLAIWRTGRFDLYKVNPPLPRLVAAIPLIMSPHQEDWSRYTANTARRPEWQVAHDFFEANGERSFEFFRMARWACLPFLLLGLIVCWRWGRELRGDWGGLMAASLWCFSPNILGHGSLITPDVPAVACGLLAAWRFSHWLKSPTWKNGTLAGICLGVALLTKTYWVSLLMIWPGLWLVWRCGQLSADRSASPRSWGGEFLQLTAILLLGLHILNTGYLYQGTGTPLREFNFYSRSFTGKSLDPELDPPGNRFRERIWGGIPVPFPQEYLLGIDVQKWDFEQRMWSYLLGEWSQEGWWHYYLVGLFFKVPVGVWILCAWALGSFIRNRNLRREFAPLLALVVPALGILLLASLQRGMNHHVRYVFAMLPV
ncbi:MAG: glycosyltransferase family 39 protein, partial [Planctomycetaceae bacterium]|nr:glycosyltransferase family 39 protein [Planctomycetaceae bacterium]